MHGLSDIKRLNAKAAKRPKVPLSNQPMPSALGYRAGPVNNAPYGLRPYIAANDNGG